MRVVLILWLSLFFNQCSLYAQNSQLDSIPKQNTTDKNKISLKLRVLKSITGNAESMTDTNRDVIANNIELLSKYNGKQINTIIIEQHNFSTNINLPKINQRDYFTTIANKLHKSSNDNAIRKNIFFKPNEILNPIIIAYNEKWLRDLSFIQDARIIAIPVKYDTNKVDIFVITKDIFPLGGNLNLKNQNSFEASLSDDNLWGTGNALKINHNFDNTRTPKPAWGYDLQLRNVFGSFINLNAGISDYTNNMADGSKSALNKYIYGELPFLHPLSNWTGGFELKELRNSNAYPSIWNDSLFNSTLNYHYDTKDFWLGYQIFFKSNPVKIRQRHIIQVRHFENNFNIRPLNYLAQLDKNYQNINANFISMTVFNQNIIRTKFLYGFGRNEDLPIGQSISLTLGKYTRDNSDIAYAGIKYERFNLKAAGTYTHLKLNMGTSYFEKQTQDFRFLSSLDLIGKLRYFENGSPYRNTFNISIAQTINNKFNEALLLYSNYGIPQLNKEQIKGGTRISGNWESVLYSAKTIYGFKSSPFVFANLTYINAIDEVKKNGGVFTAVGTGTRIRNENLIFGTIELKCFYLPRTDLQVSPWNFSFITNLKYKFNSSIINKPDFVEIN
ncbi:MAG: hypothetical protein NTW92_04925 [Bacteroidetes bacterium]|nr:hypothetical protein [Bacteroidota bacterium]